MLRPSLLLLPLALALVAGCAGAEPAEGPERLAFVGAAADSDVKVGAARRDDAFTLYVCGGADDYASRTHWFSGVVDPDQTIAVVAPDGWTLEGRWDASVAHGTLGTPDGATLTWSIGAVEGETSAGLYGGEDAGCRTGVVVTPGGDGDEVQGAWCDAGGDFAQVTPIRVAEAEGFMVRADTRLGLRALRALPIEP